MNWTLTVVPATMNDKPAYRASLVINGKTFNWHVKAEDFAAIEDQAKAYAASEDQS